MGTSVGFPSDDGAPDHGWKIYFSSLFLILGSGAFVIFRCVTRFQTRQFGADDYVIIASLCFSILLSITIQLAVVHGYGEHKADLTKPQLHTALFWFFIEQTMYKMVICLNKISLILLYKRIFVTKLFQVQCWVVMSVIISWTIASIGATIFQCIPVAKAWNSTVEGECINTSMFWMAYAVINILTDAIVLSLPIPEVFKLNLNIRQKITLCGVFLLGSFVVLCSIMRIIAVVHDDHGKDTTWDFVPRNVWSLVETNVGIICACLPVLKSPFLRGLSVLMGTTHKSTRGHGSAYELRNNSKQQGRSRNTNRSNGKTPWDDVCEEDRASDEVQIIGGPEVKSAQFDNHRHDLHSHDQQQPQLQQHHGDLDFGFGKNQIYVRRDVEMVQSDA